jgi:hypothetical protein
LAFFKRTSGKPPQAAHSRKILRAVESPPSSGNYRTLICLAKISDKCLSGLIHNRREAR